MKSDTLRRGQDVTVAVIGPENNPLYQATLNDVGTIEEAVRTAIANAGLIISPELCIYRITDTDSQVSHDYRLNADGRITLIV